MAKQKYYKVNDLTSMNHEYNILLKERDYGKSHAQDIYESNKTPPEEVVDHVIKDMADTYILQRLHRRGFVTARIKKDQNEVLLMCNIDTFYDIREKLTNVGFDLTVV